MPGRAHRQSLRVSFLILCIFGQRSGTLAQQLSREASNSAAPVQVGISPVKAFEQQATYWTSEPGWDTEIQLKNNLASQALTVTPVLRLSSGREITLTPVTIPANASAAVSVNEGLQEHAPSLVSQLESYGSVVLRFSSFNAMNLHATAVPSLHGMPVSFRIPARPAFSPSDATANNGPGSLEGIWWQARSGLKDILVFSNSSVQEISGVLTLSDAAGKQWSEPLTLGPSQTLRLATTDLLQKAGLGGNFGGVTLAVSSSASAIDGVHLMYDPGGKFSASLDTFKRDPNATVKLRTGTEGNVWTIRAPMLALRNPDPQLGLPLKTTLQPTILVRNTTSKNISTDITLNWRGDSGKGLAKLSTVQLAPFATQQLEIWAMQKQLGIPDDAHWALVSITHNAAPDDLIAVASSRNCNGIYNAETKFSSGGGGSFAGGEWRLDATHDQIAAITNIGTQPTDALLTLHYGKGQQKYELQETIPPGDQMWVDFAQLVRHRVPDRNGNLLPVDTSAVTSSLEDLNRGSNNLMVSDLAVDTVAGQAIPECFSCCGWSGETFYPDPVNLDPGYYANFSLLGTDSCNDYVYNIVTDFSSFSSSDETVAHVISGQIQALNLGTATGSAEGTINGPGQCSCNPRIVQVYVPINVLDSTPVITGLFPSNWNSGATTNVTIGGQYFGTNMPTLSFSPSTGISYALSSYNDTQILAAITVAAGTPNEQVSVGVTNNGYSGSPFNGGPVGQSPQSAFVYATVHTPVNSPEITVIAWVDGTAPDLNPLPSGANQNLITQLNSTPATCAAEIFAWSVLGSPVDLHTPIDKSYANGWLVKYSANSPPPAAISPSAQFIAGNFRLFNDFGNDGGAYQVGKTPDPCGASVQTTILNWIATGQASPYMGASGNSPSSKVYQLAEGRLGSMGQKGSETINGRTVPWIWSVIEFDSSGNPTYSDVAMFPTYSVYVNGLLQVGSNKTCNCTYPQSPVTNFIANDQTYQRTPSQIQ